MRHYGIRPARRVVRRVVSGSGIVVVIVICDGRRITNVDLRDYFVERTAHIPTAPTRCNVHRSLIADSYRDDVGQRNADTLY